MIVVSARYEGIANQFLLGIPTDYTFSPSEQSDQYATAASKTRKLEADRRYVVECREVALREVIETEVRMGITRRWDATDPEYINTVEYLATRRYHRALDDLQRLVIQRLFELHKLNVAQTGDSTQSSANVRFSQVYLFRLQYANPHCKIATKAVHGDTECSKEV